MKETIFRDKMLPPANEAPLCPRIAPARSRGDQDRRPPRDHPFSRTRGSTRAGISLALLATSFTLAPSLYADDAMQLEIPFEKYTLDNGMEVILHQDNRVPLVAVNIWVHVGALHEPSGRSGFAHLFEHLMFEGSANAGSHAISLLEKIGASQINGTTSLDRTSYFQTVPSNHLETVLWLESDRLGFLLPALTQENLDLQRNVVKNERRQNYDASPYGLARMESFNALFPAPHPFHNMVIGSMEDLAAADMSDVHAFFDTWYAPSNVTLTIAGDFERETATALVDKYFGTLPARPRPERPSVGMERLDREIEIHHEEPVATLPMVSVSWHAPPVFRAGHADGDVLASILSTGRSARLQRRLVHDRQIAQSVAAYQWSNGQQSIFVATAVARPGVTTSELLAEIDSVIGELREHGPTDREIERVVNRIETQALAGLQQLGGLGGRADQLQYYNHHVGDPGYLEADIRRYRQVTSESIRDFAREVLDPTRRVVVNAVPTNRTPEPASSSPQQQIDSNPSDQES